MEEEKKDSLTKDDVIVELMELLKKNQMEKQAGEVFEMTAMVDMLSTKFDQMNQEIVEMRMQIAKLTLQQVSPKEERSIKDNLTKMVEKAQERVVELRTNLNGIKQDIKEKVNIVLESAKEKGKIALDKLANVFHVKKRLEDMRDKIKNGIIETEKTIVKVDTIGKFLKDARQGYVNAMHTLTGKSVNSNNCMEKFFVDGIPLKKPWEWQKSVYERMILHLDTAIDKVDNLSRDVEMMQQAAKIEQTEVDIKENEHSYEEDRVKSRGENAFFAGQQTFAIAEPESKYGAEVFEKYMATHGANSETGDEKVNIVSAIKEEKR